jgi:hypothetical protein
MSQWKNIGTVVALSITAALAGTGCLAQSADDDVQTEPEITVAAADTQDNVVAADERTGEAQQNQWWGGFGGFPWLGFGGLGCGLGFGGCGLGFGGCGLGLGFPFWGGFGGCGLGFGGCGLGFGGFGGCGGWW